MPAEADAIIADLERLRASPRPRLVFASHNRRGGIGRHIQDLAAILDADAEVLLLRPHLRSFVSLSWLRPGERLALWFHAEKDWELLVALLRAVGIARVHIHHVHGLPRSVLELGRRLEAPCDLTLHDFFPICPQYQLTDASRRYCGEPGSDGCMRCLDGYPVQWGLSIPAWREAFRPVVVGAGRLIAPSADAAARMRRYFPGAEPIVRPHVEVSAPPGSPFKVLVLGGISPAKGFDLLVACARDARDRGLALHFRVVGYVALPVEPWPGLPLSVTGEFPEGSAAELVALERGDAFFFPAQWPETFSYTLSVALGTALPIVATDLGAFPERLAGRARARIVGWREGAARFNDALLELLGKPAPVESGPRAAAKALDEYRRWYSAPLGTPRAPLGALPALEPRHAAAPDEPFPQPTLRELYEDGVRCGSAASLAELGTRVARADEALAATQALEAQLAATRQALDAVLGARAASEERIRALESSRSWRLMAPFRAISRWFRS